MTFVGIFAIVVGVGMIGQWSVSYASKQIPEFKTEPIRIWFHIAAEMITAVMLIVSGVGQFFQMGWSRGLFLIAAGMLFYTAVVSPGYFAQRGQWAWLGMFSAIIVLGLMAAIIVW